jgi:hypothetical protein
VRNPHRSLSLGSLSLTLVIVSACGDNASQVDGSTTVKDAAKDTSINDAAPKDAAVGETSSADTRADALSDLGSDVAAASCAVNNGGCDPLVSCTVAANAIVCGACPSGYTGTGTNCTDIDECTTHTASCDVLVACTNTPGSYTCGNCPAGYSGGGASGCVNIDDCTPNPCLHGTCSDGVNSFTCACTAGYSGTTCATDIDDCAPNPCQNGGACTDGVDSFTCACLTGYSGTTCATDIDDCTPNPCQNGGACVDGVNSYSCACAAGYMGATCATRIAFGTGADGVAAVTAGTLNLSTTSVAAGRTCADGGDAVSYSVVSLTSGRANLAVTPATGCLAAGDEVLLINLQGTVAANANVGNYETLRIDTVTADLVTFTTLKSKNYGSSAADDDNLGTTAADQRVVLVRVPNFASISVSAGATLTVDAWNGVKGGVLFVRSAGAVTVGGSVTVDGKGYRGGARPPNTFQAGFQGESYGGAGAGAQAALFGGGGAGLGDACSGFGVAGGGAGYGSAGLNGTNSASCVGRGAAAYGDAALTKLLFGSGGGSGGNDNVLSDNPHGGAGGVGAGILVIKGLTITVTGTVSARGGAGQGDATAGCFGASTVVCWDYSGPGGGGAGGSLLLSSDQLTAGTSLVTAAAGAAGLGGSTSGGAGGVGRIAFRYATAVTGTSTPAADVAVGP